MRSTRLLLLLVLGAWAAMPSARADDLDAQTRRKAEYAFYVGRLWDLDGILVKAGDASQPDALPLLVRDFWWRGPVDAGRRMAIPARGKPDAAFALYVARLKWLQGGGQGAWPVSEEVRDPYPLLTALIQDRIRRDRHGSAGLPEDGPIEAWWLENEESVSGPVREVFTLTYGMMVRSYRGDEDPLEVRRLDHEAAELTNRNKLLWLGLLGALMALSFIGAVVAARDRGAGARS